MTADQVASLLYYRVKTVYGMASELKRDGLLQSVFLPFLQMHRRGYVLTPQGARAAALLTGDEETFRSRNGQAVPVQLDTCSSIFYLVMSLRRWWARTLQ